MSILITGATGQVGWELAHRARAKDLPVVALTQQELDIADAGAVAACLVRWAPQLVINAAAYTAVDRAEREPELAFAVNRDAVGYLAEACREREMPLFHLSTDYVFTGDRTEAYREDDPVSPLGVYGESKWAGEVVLREVLSKHVVVRVSWVFGAHGQNFVKTMLRLGAERDTLRIVNDQRGCPTAAVDVADVLLGLAQRYFKKERLEWGTFHYCGTPSTTWYEFARTIFAYAGEKGLAVPATVEPITTADYPTPAARPANSVLDCGKIETRLGIRCRPWSDALRVVVEQWAEASAASSESMEKRG